ncbi:MAG: hypothetical protein QF481_04750 [Acidimicrobiales bacterium]|nr:hypothetical protein [Acidimicrobiales bacterium]
MVDNHRSQAVARRPGFELIEEEAMSMSMSPAEVHCIRALDRDTAGSSR